MVLVHQRCGVYNTYFCVKWYLEIDWFSLDFLADENQAILFMWLKLNKSAS